jgi:predicted nucleic acid-binding protein
VCVKENGVGKRDLSSGYALEINVRPLDLELTFSPMERTERSVLNFWDGLIVESALRANAETLYTEDLNHCQVIDGLRVENPFRSD